MDEQQRTALRIAINEVKVSVDELRKLVDEMRTKSCQKNQEIRQNPTPLVLTTSTESEEEISPELPWKHHLISKLNKVTVGKPHDDTKSEITFCDLEGFELSGPPTVCENDSVDFSSAFVIKITYRTAGLLRVCGKASVYVSSFRVAHEAFKPNWYSFQPFHIASMHPNPPCKPPDNRTTSYLTTDKSYTYWKLPMNVFCWLVTKMAFVGNWCYIQPLVIAAKPPAKPPENGCSKSFDCIKFDGSAILDIKSLNWAPIVGVILHYDGLVVRLKLIGKLENITIFMKKRHDDAEGLLKFKTDSNLNNLRKVRCDDNGDMMYGLLAAAHFSGSYNGLYRNVKLDCSATGIKFMDKEISVWVLHKLVVNAFKFLTTWVLSADHVACLRNLVAEYSTFLVKSDSNTAVKSAPASMKWAAVVVNEEHDDKFCLLAVIAEDSKDDYFNSDINHDTTLDESLVVGVTVRKVTSNIFLADFSSGLVLNHAEIREWRFETQFYALKGTLRSLLPTVCGNVKMSLMSLLVGVTNLIKSWCSVFMKPPAQPPDKSLNILHGLESFVNFKLMGVQYKHDILYDLHGGRITMTVSIRGVKFGKISAPYVYERKLVYIIAYCNLFVRDIVPFSWTHKLSYELGLEQTLNFLHKVVKHVIVGGSKLQFVKACDAFVEWEIICGYLAAAMSASKGSIRKHFDIIGTNWVAVSTAFCGEIADLDLVDQASSELAETNSDMKLNDLLQSVEPHVCLMHHTQFDSFTILNIESFNKAFSEEYSAAPSILEVIMVFDSHPELRQERLSHEVFQWGMGGMERLSDANADTISLQWEDLKQVPYGGQENIVQKFHPAVKALTDNIDIQLNHTVTKIYNGSDKVMATVEEGRIFVAHTLIITTSLRFLEAYLIEFEPNLLEWKIAAISGSVGNEQCVSLKTVDMFCPNAKFLGVVASTLNGYLIYLYKGIGQPILVYMGVERSAPPAQARIDSHNKVIFKRKFAWNLLASVFTWRRKFLMFSLPRPSEVNDLEDKVQFKGME